MVAIDIEEVQRLQARLIEINLRLYDENCD